MFAKLWGTYDPTARLYSLTNSGGAERNLMKLDIEEIKNSRTNLTLVQIGQKIRGTLRENIHALMCGFHD
jgi:hypothetical protein